jgi:hypothetical protein
MGNGIRNVAYLAVIVLAVCLCPRANAVELGADWNLARNYTVAKRTGGTPTVAIYLMGAGNAYIVANASAAAANRPQMYCQPQALNLNALNYLEIFEKELARSQPEEVLNYGDEMVLLFGLIRAFPCSSK